jgi:hypothetical protein
MNESNKSNLAAESNFYDEELAILPVKICAILFILIPNGFLLIMFKKLIQKTYSNCLFFSLTLSDFLIGLVLIPADITLQLFRVWPFGNSLCLLMQLLVWPQISISFNSLFLLSLQRFLILYSPLKVNESLSRFKLLFIFLCWLSPIAYYTTWLVLLARNGYLNYAGCYFLFPLSFSLTADLVLIFLPVLITIILNLLNVYGLIRKSENGKITKQQSQSSNIDKSCYI